MRSQPVPHLFLSILTGAYRCRILPLVVLPDTLPARSASRSRLADWHPARHCGRKGNDAARPARHWWAARHLSLIHISMGDSSDAKTSISEEPVATKIILSLSTFSGVEIIRHSTSLSAVDVYKRQG